MQASRARAALRTGLIGGLVLGLAVAAQQVTTSDSLFAFGFLITLGGLYVTGYLAARDAGNYQRGPAVRAGAAAGLIAGLLAALVVVAVLIVTSVSGDYLQRVNEAVRQTYTADQLSRLAAMGVTVDLLSQAAAVGQIMCCGAGLPIVGLLLGALGGALASGSRRQRGSDGPHMGPP